MSPEPWEKYHKEIYNHCFFRLFDKQKAEDATQETFLRFYTYKGEVENPRAMLYKIATNYIIDQSRQHTSSSLEAEIELSPANEPHRYDRYDSDFYTEISKADLLKQIDGLIPEHREIVISRFFDGQTNREIAKGTGMSNLRIALIIHRSIKILRNKLHV